MYMYFFNVNIYVGINEYLLKYVYLVCYLKFRFYCLTCRIWVQLILQHQTVIRDFNSHNRNAAWISKSDGYWNYWVLINDFGFALDLSDIDLWNKDLLDTCIFRFVRDRHPPFFVCKTSWKCFRDMSPRRLEDVLQDVFKDVLEDEKLLRRRRVEYVFKTSSRPTNVCWRIPLWGDLVLV